MIEARERPILEALRKVCEGAVLSAEQSGAAFDQIIDGDADPAEIAALLTALRQRGETADELVGAVRAVRSRMKRLEVPRGLRPLLDTCGTGGDGAATLNVSTATAIVAAACGARVAKHGNRSASGRCGSAEVLQALGVSIASDPEIQTRCLADVGITFLFAPEFHPALAHAAPVRKRLPFRTIFNLIGPLANPAEPEMQLIGVPGVDRVRLVARALATLGAGRAAVVTSGEGLDEVTLSGTTSVIWVEGGAAREETWTAESFGMTPPRGPLARVEDAATGAVLIERILAGEAGPDRDVVVANTAAALRVARRVDTLAEGAARAAEALDSGAALRVLERWRSVTGRAEGASSGESRAPA